MIYIGAEPADFKFTDPTYSIVNGDGRLVGMSWMTQACRMRWAAGASRSDSAGRKPRCPDPDSRYIQYPESMRTMPAPVLALSATHHSRS